MKQSAMHYQLLQKTKKLFFICRIFSESVSLVRHIFSESGLFDLNDHLGNLMRQIRHFKRAMRHFDLSCIIPLFLNVASISVV